MNEDDTFRKLKRIDFWTMQNHWYATDIDFETHSDEEVDDFFKQYGWTYDEYCMSLLV